MQNPFPVVNKLKLLFFAALIVLLSNSTLFGIAAADTLSSFPAEIKFSELYKFPIGAHGLEASPKLLSLLGRPVRITGFLVEQENQSVAILAPVPIKVGKEDEPLADDLPANVIFLHFNNLAYQAIPFAAGPMEFTGRLDLSGFSEADGHISNLRLIVDHF